MIAKILEKQNKVLEMFALKLTDNVLESKSESTEFIMESLARNIVKFVPDVENSQVLV